MNIGQIIEFRRKELNLTLEEVGNYVGVGKSTVKKWENGFIENMRRDKIALLSKILELNPVTFINGELVYNDTDKIYSAPIKVNQQGNNTNIIGDNNVVSIILSDDEKQLIELYRKSDIIKKAKVISILAEN